MTSVAIDRPAGTGGEAGTPPGDRRFRPDVQGMRAIAILLAIVYHAGLAGFHGGYVGIEVFFVISGFVITGLLLREREATGSTSIRNFYGRRARRIIPAATLVVIVTVIASYHWLGPSIGHQTAVDGQWAALFLANFHFAAIHTNYLIAQAPPSPLLNYWSLGVEEQFYIVYPTLFLLIGWWARRGSFKARLTVVLIAVIVASYTYSIVLTSADAQSAYFSLFTRSWELALGGLIALHGSVFRRIPQTWAAVASWAGLAVILITSLTLNGNAEYPGALVAIPTLGAGVLIAAGAANPKWGVELLLRQKPIQFLAAISFSLYLWHWPILEIAAQSRGVTTLPAWDNVLLLLGAGVLATLTYYFFENPFRHSRFLGRRRWASIALGFCLIVTSLTVVTVEMHLHNEGALATPGLANLQTSDACPSPSNAAVTSLMGKGPKASHRIVARLLVVGDSTACTMLPGLEAVGSPVGVRVENAAVIGCGVVSGTLAPDVVNGDTLSNSSRLCQSRANAAETRALRLGRPNVVLWASSWERSSLVVGSGVHQKVVDAGPPEWSALLLRRMEQRVAQFTATGATVVMLTQAPFVNSGNPKAPTPEDETFERLNVLLKRFASHRPHVEIVDLADYICPGGPPCRYIVDGEFVRGDGAHFTAEGSLFVARWLMPQLGIKALDRPIAPLPTMRIVLPRKAGTVLKGSSLLDALGSFNLGISKVQFQITGDGMRNVVIGTATHSQYGWLFTWPTRSVPNGTYTLRSVAYNSSGNSSTSRGLTVRVANKS